MLQGYHLCPVLKPWAGPSSFAPGPGHGGCPPRMSGHYESSLGHGQLHKTHGPPQLPTKGKGTSSLSKALLFGMPGAQSQTDVLRPPVDCSGRLRMGPVPVESHPRKLPISGLILDDDTHPPLHLPGMTLESELLGKVPVQLPEFFVVLLFLM